MIRAPQNQSANQSLRGITMTAHPTERQIAISAWHG
jgi:hypothetical protein